MHNYERVCEEKLIGKHKFIAINLSIDGNHIFMCLCESFPCKTNAVTVNSLLLIAIKGEEKTALDIISEYDYN